MKKLPWIPGWCCLLGHNFLSNSCFSFTLTIVSGCASAWTSALISGFWSRFLKERKPTCFPSIFQTLARCSAQVHEDPEIAQKLKYSVGDAYYFYGFCLIITQSDFLPLCYARSTGFSFLRSKMPTGEREQSECLILFFFLKNKRKKKEFQFTQSGSCFFT